MIRQVENTMMPTGTRTLVTEQATQNGAAPALGVRRPETNDMAIPVPVHCLPLTDNTVLELYEYVIAPWVRMLDLREFKVRPGIVSAMLPQNDALKFSSGAVCGQAIMAAIDTVASLSMATTERVTKGTVYQHTHFLRPAVNDDYYVRAEVLRFGRASAFTEARVSFASTGKLVAHASLEFAF
ncbi:PaaI family thioesterase [Bradyrhizobium lablabi]|uniref:PaaI family thioesterase n=1 Tax=Bradyrhizobium lablabi TaxID=722472 RepID=UPI001BA7AE39|nr:PaaI family thioesterase [Bradyrhizobium lablabi]MBR0694290.1 PaaI family thioesterase [Bradyrhizobium lablabi]